MQLTPTRSVAATVSIVGVVTLAGTALLVGLLFGWPVAAAVVTATREPVNS